MGLGKDSCMLQCANRRRSSPFFWVGGVSHSDVSLSPCLEVSWKSVGIDGGGDPGERGRGSQEKGYIEKWPCQSAVERIFSFNV